MWICFNDGFLSIVPRGHELLLRARKRSHLAAFLTPQYEYRIQHTPERDYHWRALLPRGNVAALVERRVRSMDYGSGINYTGFKASVKEDALLHMYLNWWRDHERYQRREEEEWESWKAADSRR